MSEASSVLPRIPERRGLPAGSRILAVAALSVILAGVGYFYTDKLNTPGALWTYTAICVVLAILAGLIDVLDYFRDTQRKTINSTMSGIETAIANTSEQTRAELRANLVDYSEFISSYPPSQEARTKFLAMMHNHRQLGTAADPVLTKIGSIVLTRQMAELSINNGSDILLKMPRVTTYPIYDAIMRSRSQADTLYAVNRIDLDWWVDGPIAIQYVRDNHEALRDGRLSEIKRIFIIDRRRWGSKAQQDLKTIRDRVMIPELRGRIALKTIFDDEIREEALQALDVVIRSPNLAIEWVHAYDDGSYPDLRVSTSDGEVKRLFACAHSVFTNAAARPIDELLQRSI